VTRAVEQGEPLEEAVVLVVAISFALGFRVGVKGS
jgi:hypothetical protein